MERLAICSEDVARWKSEQRDDILANLGEQSAWRAPGACPFIAELSPGRYACSIYDTRPLTCRDYPLAINHMEFVRCEMLEPGDTDETVATFMRHANQVADPDSDPAPAAPPARRP